MLMLISQPVQVDGGGIGCGGTVFFVLPDPDLFFALPDPDLVKKAVSGEILLHPRGSLVPLVTPFPRDSERRLSPRHVMSRSRLRVLLSRERLRFRCRWILEA